MEQNGMTDYQFKSFLKTLLGYIKKKKRKKAIKLIKSLLDKN